ncbi:MAG TPA: hypothetical protein VII96_01445, partial [Acidimicrobiales bacterium]
AIDTASTAHAGSIPSAGPAVQGGGFGPGGGFPGGRGGFPGGRGGFPGGRGGFPGGTTGAAGGATGAAGGIPGGGTAAGGAPGAGAGGGFPGGGTGGPPTGMGGFPRGGTSTAGGAVTLPKGTTLPNGTKLPRSVTLPGGFAGGPGGAGGAGGLLEASTPGKQLTALLKSHASRFTWVAATTGSNSAAGYQLATGEPVLSIGGFNGTDPAPTLPQFQKYVAEGKIHFYIGGNGMGFGPSAGATTSYSSAIATWVKAHYAATTVDGVTVYDLTVRAH